MEKSLAKVSFSGFQHGVDSIELDEDDPVNSSDDTKKMVAKRNRKGKKSGGFQSMGVFINSIACVVAIYYNIMGECSFTSLDLVHLYPKVYMIVVYGTWGTSPVYGCIL